jgi:uncharacterized membrane protein
VQREVAFRIAEPEGKEDFELGIPSRLYLERGGEKAVYAVIKNLTNEEREVKVSVIGDLPASHPYTVKLMPQETLPVKITVKARDSDKAGLHELDLHVWTERQEEKRVISAYVGMEHEMWVRVLNKADIFACDISNGTFEVMVANTGDYNENVRLKASAIPQGLSAVFSEDSFSLRAGETRIVYLTVHASYGTETGEKTIKITAEASGRAYTEELTFEVLEAPENHERTEGVLVFLNHPENVALKAGTESRVEVTLYNDSAKDIALAEISMSGAPKAVYSFFPQTTVPAGESVTVTGRIVAGKTVKEGTYTVSLVALSEKYIDSAGMKISVEGTGAEEEETTDGFLAGIAGLATLLPPVGGGVIIIIVVVAILYVLYLPYSCRDIHTTARDFCKGS